MEGDMEGRAERGRKVEGASVGKREGEDGMLRGDTEGRKGREVTFSSREVGEHLEKEEGQEAEGTTPTEGRTREWAGSGM
jgi:hypothetical protein